MSGKNHKPNGNFILSATSVSSATSAAATAAAAAGAKTNNHSNNNNNNNTNINNTNGENYDIKSQQQHHTTAIASKLQAPQQLQQQYHHQRRSLLPPSSSQSLHFAAVQHHLHTTATTTTTPSTVVTTVTTSANPQSRQLQTVATIHQQHSQQPQTERQIPTSAAAQTGNKPPALPTTPTLHHLQQQQQHTAAVTQARETIASPPPAPPIAHTHTRRRLQHLQQTHLLKSSHNLKPAHSIPPRYQPPPQPQTQTLLNSIAAGGGILKHLGGAAGADERLVTNGKSSHHSPYLTDTGAHLNLKYPPDIPQLSSVYIPDSIKTGIAVNNLQQSRYLQQQQDMLKFVRKTDQDHPSPNASVTSSATGGIPTATGRLTVEQNRQLQSLINELRALKEQNQRLLDDNQELRDLCCFLDDDRQKGRKLAREWQRFGRYTASVMRQEVAAYQNKLRQLDDKQQELITDNLELKELCLYLDEERAHVAANTLCANCGTSTRNVLRDDGDGSSSSTNADETITALRNYERQLPDIQLRTAALNDQTLQYVRSLERRIQQLEEERVTTTTPTANLMSQQQQQQQQPEETLPEPISGRPEAVVRALQVLEVREQLERDRLSNLDMDDGEKALVREMCNVVWRKLEGNPNSSHALEPL